LQITSTIKVWGIKIKFTVVSFIFQTGTNIAKKPIPVLKGMGFFYSGLTNRI